MLEWVNTSDEDPADPGREPALAGTALAGLGDADPSTALSDLRARLEAGSSAAGEPKARNETVALIQDAGAAHVAALLARCFASAAGTQAAREATWKSLVDYQLRLAQALCASAGGLLTAESAVRALSACRTLAKIHLVHYASVPGRLWHVAYAIHAAAERAGCSTTPVHARSDHRTMTSAEQELLRLLMLQASAPDMMAPEQIEVADRVVEQVGGDFTLRPPGVADNPFCFDPGGDAPPRRAPEPQAEPAPAARHFGAGMGFDSLERIARQLGTTKLEDFKAFGKDIAPRAQLSAVQHLLTFWRADCPYSPPAHSPASGTLQVVHGFGQTWQLLSQARRGAGELSLADSSAGVPQAPETWDLRDAGGSELGASLPQASAAWAKCGEVVGLSVRNGSERWAGVIRRMHAVPGTSAHADIAILSREPREVSLRAVLGKYEDSAFSDAASKQFAGHTVHAIILSDGAEGSQPPNLLLPPEEWKEGRIYEVQAKDVSRYLRGLQAVRRGDDYVRATFEWVSGPEA